jgi:hypothetical protein
MSKPFVENTYSTPTVVMLTRKQILEISDMCKNFPTIQDFELHISTNATILRFSMNLDHVTTTQVNTEIS